MYKLTTSAVLRVTAALIVAFVTFLVLGMILGRRYVAALDCEYHRSLVLELPNGFRRLIAIQPDPAGPDVYQLASNNTVRLALTAEGAASVRNVEALNGRTSPSAVYADGKLVSSASIEDEKPGSRRLAVFWVEFRSEKSPFRDGGDPSRDVLWMLWILVGDGAEYKRLDADGPIPGPISGE